MGVTTGGGVGAVGVGTGMGVITGGGVGSGTGAGDAGTGIGVAVAPTGAGDDAGTGAGVGSGVGKGIFSVALSRSLANSHAIVPTITDEPTMYIIFALITLYLLVYIDYTPIGLALAPVVTPVDVVGGGGGVAPPVTGMVVDAAVAPVAGAALVVVPVVDGALPVPPVSGVVAGVFSFFCAATAHAMPATIKTPNVMYTYFILQIYK